VKIIKDDKSDTPDFTFIILLLLNAGKFTHNSKDTDRAHMPVIWIFFIFVSQKKIEIQHAATGNFGWG